MGRGHLIAGDAPTHDIGPAKQRQKKGAEDSGSHRDDHTGCGVILSSRIKLARTELVLMDFHVIIPASVLGGNGTAVPSGRIVSAQVGS